MCQVILTCQGKIDTFSSVNQILFFFSAVSGTPWNLRKKQLDLGGGDESLFSFCLVWGVLSVVLTGPVEWYLHRPRDKSGGQGVES